MRLAPFSFQLMDGCVQPLRKGLFEAFGLASRIQRSEGVALLIERDIMARKFQSGILLWYEVHQEAVIAGFAVFEAAEVQTRHRVTKVSRLNVRRAHGAAIAAILQDVQFKFQFFDDFVSLGFVHHVFPQAWPPDHAGLHRSLRKEISNRVSNGTFSGSGKAGTPSSHASMEKLIGLSRRCSFIFYIFHSKRREGKMLPLKFSIHHSKTCAIIASVNSEKMEI